MWSDPPEEDSAGFADAIPHSALIIGWALALAALVLFVADLSGLLP